MNKQTTLVTLSGGMDSAVCLALALQQCTEVHAVHFVYGAKHSVGERLAARQLVQHYGMARDHLHIIDIEMAFRSFNSGLLTGHISTDVESHTNIASTVVPFRNGVFFALAAGLAESLGLGSICVGTVGGSLYADCSPDFIASMSETIGHGLEQRIELWAPLITCVDKSEVVELAIKHQVPIELTLTCYAGTNPACGKCGSCRSRLEAFHNAGHTDPLVYVQ